MVGLWKPTGDGTSRRKGRASVHRSVPRAGGCKFWRLYGAFRRVDSRLTGPHLTGWNLLDAVLDGREKRLQNMRQPRAREKAGQSLVRPNRVIEPLGSGSLCAFWKLSPEPCLAEVAACGLPIEPGGSVQQQQKQSGKKWQHRLAHYYRISGKGSARCLSTAFGRAGFAPARPRKTR